MRNEQAGCRCVICHDYGDRDERDPAEAGTVGHVLEHGWSVLMVPEDEQGPGWAYTIGLWHSHRLPELAMFGLDVELMRTCLNDIGRRAVAGPPVEAGQALDDVIERWPVHLRTVNLRWFRPFFGRAIAFYRRPPIPMLQVVWPDRNGRCTWDAGSEDVVRARQPQLWLPPDVHPKGVWTQDL
ncbi:DUF4262 domain-containing protein [Dactylosporangium sp. CA-152071]|uniref:DUF4262 domain-containing protein n=1 Tax=Dactylosporangium sp. CA-152071 TaxID=3239933 RepID=UPI003D90D671